MAEQESAPALSTPATHIFEDDVNTTSAKQSPPLSDEQLYIMYEIERTISEIKQKRFQRVALQFPDDMLHHAPRIFDALNKGLLPTKDPESRSSLNVRNDELLQETQNLTTSQSRLEIRLYILGDTSYGSCCVDEIAAEHVDADAVVHYGRACLSPTARLPVIYVFTVQILPDFENVIKCFEKLYGNKDQKIILMADVTYQHHLQEVAMALRRRGYLTIYEAEVKSDPSSPLPNRTVPEEVASEAVKLKAWKLFYLSDPPKSLLLTLNSRVAEVGIYSTDPSISQTQRLLSSSASSALSRRYALLTSVSTVSIFGILINTLSVKNYLHMVDHVKARILNAGKKSYTFVVGKVNAAKVANFSEIGAWVVIGCWESSLIDSTDFWKPVITPFELEIALKGDQQRVWTGEWNSDYQSILNKSDELKAENGHAEAITAPHSDENDGLNGDHDSEPESAPPEFDLRTGQYVSHSRPMLSKEKAGSSGTSDKNNVALTKRSRNDIAVMGGQASPGAEYLRSSRTWKGLGSDLEIAYENDGMTIEEGRSGIARGYTHSQTEAKV